MQKAHGIFYDDMFDEFDHDEYMYENYDADDIRMMMFVDLLLSHVAFKIV